jgi:hypothetical protein
MYRDEGELGADVGATVGAAVGEIVPPTLVGETVGAEVESLQTDTRAVLVLVVIPSWLKYSWAVLCLK